VLGWAGLKLTGGALQLLNLVNGLTSLSGKKISLPGLENGGGDGTTPTGGGPGWLAGVKVKATDWISKGVQNLGGTAGLFNASFIGDYLLHNTEVGRAINPEYGGDISKLPGAVGEAATGWFENIKKNLSDWYNTASSVFSPTVEFWKNYWGNWETEHSATNSRLFDPQKLQSEWDALFGGNKKLEVPTGPVLPEATTTDLEKQIGVLEIPARVVLDWLTGDDGGGDHGFANGLPMVPWDGFPAILHKGERVVPAREVSSRSYSSNLYVESMIMNNGTDAEGLAAAMAAQNRRISAGFGW
jgi:hypothetical protein